MARVVPRFHVFTLDFWYRKQGTKKTARDTVSSGGDSHGGGGNGGFAGGDGGLHGKGAMAATDQDGGHADRCR